MLLTGCAGRGYSYNILAWHTCACTRTHKYTLLLSCSTLSWSPEWWFGDRPAWIFKQQLLPGPGSSLRPHYLTWCSLNPGASRQQSVQPCHTHPAPPASPAPHLFFFTTTSTLIISDGTFTCAFDEKQQDEKIQRLLEGKKYQRCMLGSLLANTWVVQHKELWSVGLYCC